MLGLILLGMSPWPDIWVLGKTGLGDTPEDTGSGGSKCHSFSAYLLGSFSARSHLPTAGDVSTPAPLLGKAGFVHIPSTAGFALKWVRPTTWLWFWC